MIGGATALAPGACRSSNGTTGPTAGDMTLTFGGSGAVTITWTSCGVYTVAQAQAPVALPLGAGGDAREGCRRRFFVGGSRVGRRRERCPGHAAPGDLERDRRPAERIGREREAIVR